MRVKHTEASKGPARPSRSIESPSERSTAGMVTWVSHEVQVTRFSHEVEGGHEVQSRGSGPKGPERPSRSIESPSERSTARMACQVMSPLRKRDLWTPAPLSHTLSLIQAGSPSKRSTARVVTRFSRRFSRTDRRGGGAGAFTLSLSL